MTFLPQLATAGVPLAVGPDRHLNPLLGSYINDAAWQVEEKYDGIRMVGTGRRGCLNRNMDTLTKPIPTAVRKYVESMPEGVLLDGELVGERWHVFDLLIVGRLHAPLHARQDMLATFLTRYADASVVRVQPAVTSAEKITLVHDVLMGGREGVLLKSRTAPHTSGRSLTWLKVKNTRTVDAVISRLHTDREAADVSVLVDPASKRWKVIGTVSMVGRRAKKGDVVEVEYLYMRDKLVQPRILRVRDDKRADQCTPDQLTIN